MTIVLRRLRRADMTRLTHGRPFEPGSSIVLWCRTAACETALQPAEIARKWRDQRDPTRW